jgi:hypothetical protein
VPEVILTQQHATEAARARESGRPLVLHDNHRVEPRAGGWVVVDRYGSVLTGIEESEWDATREGQCEPPLKFSSPVEALSGYLRSAMIAEARSERRASALRRLGREE